MNNKIGRLLPLFAVLIAAPSFAADKHFNRSDLPIQIAGNPLDIFINDTVPKQKPNLKVVQHPNSKHSTITYTQQRVETKFYKHRHRHKHPLS
jgi:hypothetical protein